MVYAIMIQWAGVSFPNIAGYYSTYDNALEELQRIRAEKPFELVNTKKIWIQEIALDQPMFED